MHRPPPPPPAATALDMLRECVRLLRADPATFTSVAFFLLCPFSAALLAGVPLADPFTRAAAARLSAAASASGLPLSPFFLYLSQRLVSAAFSALFYIPLLASLLLAARAAVAHAVASLYSSSGRTFRAGDFYAALRACWLRVLSTFACACAAAFGIAAAFLGLLFAACSAVSELTHRRDLVVYIALLVAVGFVAVCAHGIVICNVAGVVAAVEEGGGTAAMVRADELVHGRRRAGVAAFLGTAAGLLFVDELFEHRVKTLSYGDGSSRLWEGPLLVVMFAFIQLADAMISAVYYFSCRSSAAADAAEDDGSEEGRELLDAGAMVE